MRIAALALVLSFAASSAFADSATVAQIDIVDFGLYAIDTGEATPDQGTPTGEIMAATVTRHIEETTTIEGAVGAEFGFQYVVVGEPDGAEVTLDIVHLYPPEGITDPAGGETLHESRYQRVKRIGETAYLGYGFESAWEIVPGAWGFEIWHDGRKLAEKSFTVER